MFHEFTESENIANAICWHCKATYALCISDPRECIRPNRKAF